MPPARDTAGSELVCPRCGEAYGPEERFCATCGLPLTFSVRSRSGAPVSERHRVARKIKPQLAEGALVRVAGARNQAEGELIQAMLLEEGVPSVLRRSAGFDVPDFGAGGPRDVLVPVSGLATAREALLAADVIPSEPTGPPVAPVRLLVGLLVALALGALLVWVLSTVVH